MQALGMIETKGMLAAIEAADTMLKAADVSFFEKTKVGGGRVTILVTGDVAAVKAAVDAAVTAVRQIKEDCLLSGHVIPRPHDETMGMFDAQEEASAAITAAAESTAIPAGDAKAPESEETVKEQAAKDTGQKEKTEAKGSKKNKTE